MVMAAGLGKRLRPLTYGAPKPMVPVANRPIMEHILRLLPRHGFEQVIANLHWFPDLLGEVREVRDRLGEPVLPEQIEDVLDHWPVQNRRQRLRYLVRDRAQARAQAGRENHRLHRLPRHPRTHE